MVARFGADSTRMYALFAAPPDRDLDWQEAGVEGVHRFLSRTYRFVMRHASAARNAKSQTAASGAPGPGQLSPAARSIQRKLHQTIERVTDDFQGRWHFNTCVAAVMELVNALYGVEEQIASGDFPSEILADAQRKLALLLAPFAPYLAAELWEMLGESSTLLRQPWPEFDPALAKEDEIEYPIQINGKLRSRISVPADSPEDLVRERAMADEKAKAALEGKQLVKVIVVPSKLVNIVIR
jgi:leucyl-tRNA synthetase